MSTGHVNNHINFSDVIACDSRVYSLVLLPPSGQRIINAALNFHSLFFLLINPYSVFFSVFRELIWQDRSVPLPMQSAPQSILRTASVMFSMSPHWRLCPASIGLSSNVLAHVAASSGSLSSHLGLRSMSTHLPLERTGPKAVCSCRTRVRQKPNLCVLMDVNHTAHELNLLVNSCQIFALHKGQFDENKYKCYPVEFFKELFVHL